MNFEHRTLNEENRELSQRIKWLLLLRVVILSFFLGAVALFHFLKEGENPALFHALQIPLLAAYIFSLGSALSLSRVKTLRWFAHLQIDFDVLLVTGIVFITGDVESPFPFLYNLAIMNSAILLFYRGAFLTAGVSGVCYGGLLLWSHVQFPRPAVSTFEPLVLGLTLNIPTFFIIGFLGGFLAKRLYEAEQLLKEKQRAYRDLEALKEALVEGIGGGVAITGLKGEINYFNRQAQTLLSLRERAVLGKKLTELFPNFSYSFDGVQQQSTTGPNEFAYADPQGRGNKQLRLTLAPLSDQAQRRIGFVAILEDITRLREMEDKIRFEEELRKARARELDDDQSNGAKQTFQFEGVIGRGGGVEKIYGLVQKVAATDTTVLITGESGTGKELVARAIHGNGPRCDRPFVAVNCGAIPEHLMESELFGHVRGAFTGAVSDHEGVFKQADGGSIFLDEVGELPLHLQVKLLRVLQEKTFTPVGGSKQVKVNVRVISASNKDLRKEVEKKAFREDLFYRLNVLQMVMPPLRNRREDIPGLADYFIRKFSQALNKKVEEISSEALMYLMNYPYPGNIRELENMIEHAVAVTGSNIITEEDLPAHIKGVPISEEFELFEKTAPGGADNFFNKGLSLDEELATHEKCILLGALKRAKGVQKRAAEILGINYRSLRHRLEKYGMLNSKNHTSGGEDQAE
ncbi:MAG: sigma-54 interaction domain-containing protein [Candidatus Binatia bacterium]